MRFLQKIFLFLLCLISLNFSQTFQVKEYTNEDGLFSNLVKDIGIDNNHFVWAATDGGLLKFDGKQFNGLSLNYIKSLSFTDNKLMFVYDMGICSMNPNDREFKYDIIIKGNNELTDSMVFFPRSFFTDSKNRFWIGDYTRISRLEGKKLKTYKTPYFSGTYDRSVFFHEDKNGNVIAISHDTYLFKYDEKADTFSVLNTNTNKVVYTSGVQVKNDYFILGTSGGVYRLYYNEDYTQFRLQLMSENLNVSWIEPYINGLYIVSTFNAGLFIYDDESGIFTPIAPELAGISINKVKYDSFRDLIWVGTNSGLFLLKKYMFDGFLISSNFNDMTSDYISFISDVGNSNIAFTNQDEIISLQKNQAKIFYKATMGGDIASFTSHNGIYYIALLNGNILKMDSTGKILQTNNVTNKVRIGRLNYDPLTGNLWGSLDLAPHIFRLDPEGNIKWYDMKSAGITNVQCVKRLSDGNLYLLGIGRNSFFLKMDSKTDTWIDIGKKLVPELYFTASDLTSDDKGNIYIASDIAAFKVDKDYNSIVKISVFDDEEIKNIKAVAIDKSGRIWLGTEKGLYCLYENDFAFFSKSDGLSHPAITYQGIVIDDADNINLATARGISFAEAKDIKLLKTISPSLEFEATDKNNNILPEGSSFVNGTKIKIKYTSLQYPVEKVTYQIMLEGFDKNWNLYYETNEIVYPNLNSGKYTFKVRAKKLGYLWSEFSEVTFEIYNPWYATTTMILVYLGVFAFVVFFGSRKINDYRTRLLIERKAELENIVEERTLQLKKEKQITEELLFETEKKSQELQKANDIKGQLLSIAAHDLKNPLQTILGYEFLVREEFDMQGEELEMVNTIFKTAKRMLNIISELLESAAVKSSSIDLNFTNADIAHVVNETVAHNAARAKQKGQSLSLYVEENLVSKIDTFWIKEAIENLISNAIKYSPKEKSIDVSVYREDGFNCIKVKDYGPGLTEEDKSRLFSKFQRLSARPTGGESSTGLGLYIVKDIIEKHSGKIEVESIFGEGAAFIVKIPANQI